MDTRIESLARSAVLGLTEELHADTDLTVSATARMLQGLFPECQLHFVDIDPTAKDIAVATTADLPDAAYLARLSNVVDDHPLIRSYLPLRTRNLGPRRMSDVIDQNTLSHTKTYNELLKPTGTTHQISIITSIRGTRATAWVINRSGCDFRQNELDIAIALQPSLALLHFAFGRANPQFLMPRTSDVENHYHLTEREVEVLTLMADGLSAIQIAHVLQISVRTVQKHLANAYEKMHAHTGLVAVTRARSAGIIA